MKKVRSLIKQAIAIAKGEAGEPLTLNYSEDARYVYPERIDNIIKTLEEALDELEKRWECC